MPQLPLPLAETALFGGDLPVPDDGPVRALFDVLFRTTDSAPVREGLIAACTAILQQYQDRAQFSAAERDILNATGIQLDEKGSVVGMPRADGEDDTTYRFRQIGLPLLVTPKSILAATDAILAPYTAVKSQYCESIHDRWFLGTGAKTWSSHVWDRTTSRSPHYPDRLYPDDSVENAGFVRQQSNPGGARCWKDSMGRLFMLRVPDISGTNQGAGYSFNTSLFTQSSQFVSIARGGLFVAQNASTLSDQNRTYLRTTGGTAQTVFQQIVSVINRIQAHSIRWILFVDPKLK